MEMNETINTAFPAETLPEWARGNVVIRWLAKRDLAYRCAVCAAETAQRQNSLRQEAYRRHDDYCNGS